MKVLTAAAMREADRRTVGELGLPGAVLMENAGLRVAEAALVLNPRHGKVVIVAGPGNNGGDGAVAARHLSRAGLEVSLWATQRPEQYRGEAGNNFRYLSNSGVSWLHIFEDKGLSSFRTDLEGAVLVVDALLGTGTGRPVEGLLAEIINFINGQKAPVLAVDIPSGINADTGRMMGVAVRAHWTVTLAFPKQGLFLFPGAELAGRISIADIHIPAGLVEQVGTELITAEQVRKYLPPRPIDSHKGSFGRVLLWAGSPGMTGAAALAGKAALRGGAGLVYLAAPPTIRAVLESKLEEVIVRGIRSIDDEEERAASEQETTCPEAAADLLTLADDCQVLAAGPGLSPSPGAVRTLRRIIRECPVPLVLDAGALEMLSGNPGVLGEARPPVVITPHPGEMAGLTGLSTAEVQDSRLDLARRCAMNWRCTVVLKGARTIVATPDGKACFNPTGSPSLATAGAGDLLTGLIAALIAQGLAAEKAARIGVYLHGLAGDLLPARGAAAGDLLTNFTRAFELVEEENSAPSILGPFHRLIRPEPVRQKQRWM